MMIINNNHTNNPVEMFGCQEDALQHAFQQANLSHDAVAVVVVEASRVTP